jgi:hypothetical protein
MILAYLLLFNLGFAGFSSWRSCFGLTERAHVPLKPRGTSQRSKVEPNATLPKVESNASIASASTTSGPSTMAEEESDMREAFEEEKLAREAELEEKANAAALPVSFKEKKEENLKKQENIKQQIAKIQARRVVLEARAIRYVKENLRKMDTLEEIEKLRN